MGSNKIYFFFVFLLFIFTTFYYIHQNMEDEKVSKQIDKLQTITSQCIAGVINKDTESFRRLDFSDKESVQKFISTTLASTHKESEQADIKLIQSTMAKLVDEVNWLKDMNKRCIECLSDSTMTDEDKKTLFKKLNMENKK